MTNIWSDNASCRIANKFSAAFRLSLLENNIFPINYNRQTVKNPLNLRFVQNLLQIEIAQLQKATQQLHARFI